jgi:MOSC domain-containing protein YiiM
MTSRPTVLAVNVVHEVRRGPTRRTAIDKRPVEGPVPVGALGLDGDTQCDRRFHGGPDKALYVFAGEEAAWWSTELGRDLPPGRFGENLTTAAVDVDGALIGERWRIGTRDTGIVVEVRLPRDPCGNLSAHLGIPRFHRRFAGRGRPGAYLAVLRPGTVAAGDRITVVHRPRHGVTVADCASGAPRAAMRDLLAAEITLAEPLRRRAERLVRPAT